MKNSIDIVSCRLEKEKILSNDYKITKPSDAIRTVIDNFGDLNKEYLFSISLNNKNIPNNIYIVATGTLNKAGFEPSEMFRAAIVSNSNKIIMCHNHPSGDITPSNDDLKSFKRIQKCGEILGIDVLDSIIINEKEAFSIGANQKIDYSDFTNSKTFLDSEINAEDEEETEEDER